MLSLRISICINDLLFSLDTQRCTRNHKGKHSVCLRRQYVFGSDLAHTQMMNQDASLALPWSSSLSLRSWWLLHVKAVRETFRRPPFTEINSELFCKAVFGYLGHAPAGVKIAVKAGNCLKIVDSSTGSVDFLERWPTQDDVILLVQPPPPSDPLALRGFSKLKAVSALSTTRIMLNKLIGPDNRCFT